MDITLKPNEFCMVEIATRQGGLHIGFFNRVVQNYSRFSRREPPPLNDYLILNHCMRLRRPIPIEGILIPIFAQEKRDFQLEFVSRVHTGDEIIRALEERSPEYGKSGEYRVYIPYIQKILEQQP